jgi:hypothetical protein
MTTEQSKIFESRLQRLVELRWQREVIMRWLEGPSTPGESPSQLQEMLAQVTAELKVLEGAPSADDGEGSVKRRG